MFECPSELRSLVQRVRSSLTADLRSPEFKGWPGRIGGNCYVASEAVYHMMGPRERKRWSPANMKHRGISHWFLLREDGAICDPTGDKMPGRLEYDKAKRLGFLTTGPSARARELIDRARRNPSMSSEEEVDTATYEKARPAGPFPPSKAPPGGLKAYDWIVINTSAGKDSQAMTDYIVELADQAGVRDRLVMVHADLGRVEWQGTKELAEEHARAYGLRFVVERRTQNDLLEQIEARGMFPDSKNRYCTSDQKTKPVSRLFTRLAGETREALKKAGRPDRPVKIISALGIRGQESLSRLRKYAPEQFVVDKSTTGKGTKKQVWRWLPIFWWSADEVWARIEAAGTRYHAAYDLGMSRLSCAFCVFASNRDLLIAAENNPELFQEYLRVEAKIGHSFKNKMSLAQVSEKLKDMHSKGQRASASAPRAPRALPIAHADPVSEAQNMAPGEQLGLFDFLESPRRNPAHEPVEIATPEAWTPEARRFMEAIGKEALMRRTARQNPILMAGNPEPIYRVEQRRSMMDPEDAGQRLRYAREEKRARRGRGMAALTTSLGEEWTRHGRLVVSEVRSRLRVAYELFKKTHTNRYGQVHMHQGFILGEYGKAFTQLDRIERALEGVSEIDAIAAMNHELNVSLDFIADHAWSRQFGDAHVAHGQLDSLIRRWRSESWGKNPRDRMAEIERRAIMEPDDPHARARLAAERRRADLTPSLTDAHVMGADERSRVEADILAIADGVSRAAEHFDQHKLPRPIGYRPDEVQSAYNSVASVLYRLPRRIEEFWDEGALKSPRYVRSSASTGVMLAASELESLGKLMNNASFGAGAARLHQLSEWILQGEEGSKNPGSALTRSKPSAPMALALELGAPRFPALDFGAGKGRDLRELRKLGKADGYDPETMPKKPKRSGYAYAQMIYVLNVIRSKEGRKKALKEFKSYLRSGASWMVAVRGSAHVDRESKRRKWKREGDGWRGSGKAFQKGFTPRELQACLVDAGFGSSFQVYEKGGSVVAVHSPKARNCCPINPSRNPKKPHPDARPISELPASVRNSEAFKQAVKFTEQRYGAPTHYIPVKLPPGASKVQAPVGEMGRFNYLAADRPGEVPTQWYHDPGDRGEGERRSKPQMFAWDPVHNCPQIAFPPGSEMSFTPRGIVG